MTKEINQETYENVKKVLESNKDARASDNALLVVYYSNFENVDVDNTSIREFYQRIEHKEILTTRYILRLARKVKEDYPELKGNPKSREQLSEQYKKEFSN